MNNVLTIDWNLGNSCNLDCSYCYWELKNGANPFPPIEQFSPAFAHLVEQTRAFSCVQIEFSGGEPTQSSALKQSILDSKNTNVRFKLVSNGQSEIAWWEEVIGSMYGLVLTYHLHTDLEHFKQVVAVARTTDLKVYVAITPDKWEQGMLAYRQLKELHPHTILQLLYSNFSKGNDQYLKYSDDQWAEYYAEKGIDAANQQQVETTIEFKRVNHLNDYYGHMCWAGYNQIIIDNFGYVYRGWCKAGDSLGNVFDHTIVLDKQPAACPKRQCKNGFDLQAHKSKGSWGFA